MSRPFILMYSFTDLFLVFLSNATIDVNPPFFGFSLHINFDKTAVLSSKRRLIGKSHRNCNANLLEVFHSNHMLTWKDWTLFKGATSRVTTLKSSALSLNLVLLSLWWFSILENYYIQLFFNLSVFCSWQKSP